MIHRRSILALAVLMLATGVVSAQNLEGILAKVYDARGGLDKIKAVESVRISGKLVIPGMMEAPLTMEWKRPDKIRMDFETPQGNGTQAFDGETAWAHMPGMGGAMALSGPQADSIRRQSDMLDGPLVDWKDKGNAVEYLGEGEVDGVAVHKIKLTRDDETETTFYFDAGNFLVIRQNGTMMGQGGETEVDTFIGDYKEIGGLMMAHSIKTELIDMGMTQNLTMESVEFNVEINDARFAMPEAAEAEAGGAAGHGHGGDHSGHDHD